MSIIVRQAMSHRVRQTIHKTGFEKRTLLDTESMQPIQLDVDCNGRILNKSLLARTCRHDKLGLLSRVLDLQFRHFLNTRPLVKRGTKDLPPTSLISNKSVRRVPTDRDSDVIFDDRAVGVVDGVRPLDGSLLLVVDLKPLVVKEVESGSSPIFLAISRQSKLSLQVDIVDK